MIVTLICLLAFILLGWHSLGMSGGFAAGTGSTILAGVGKLMGSLGEEDEEDGGGGGGGSETSADNDAGADRGGGSTGNDKEKTEAALEEVVLMYDADN